MASECVAVKQEPTESVEESDNEVVKPVSHQSQPEFVNIKMEIEVESPKIRIKSELTAERSPTPETNWHLPVTEEDEHPEKYLEVCIKEEPVDYDCDPMNDDDSESLQPTTSTDLKKKKFKMPSAGRTMTYCCPVCKKTYANQGNVQRHMLIHTKARLKCAQCDGEFVNKMRLDKHVFLKHTVVGDRAYQCDGCEKRFKSSSNLMQHKKVHLQKKPHKCPLCSKTFSFKTNLKKHQGKSRCKLPSDNPLICHVCNKVFEKEYLLKSHLRRHDTDKPFTCEQCNMKFKYKSTLSRHLQLHDGIRPFPCPMCDKSFTHLGLLKPHLRIHTGEKPYKCPVCSKKFTHKHNMERHALRHNKIKHLVCDICHKEFPKESRLKYHMKIHVNEKYFACKVCPKRFSHKQNVLRHYSRKHPGQTFSCPDTDASVALKVWDTFKSKYNEDEAEEILG